MGGAYTAIAAASAQAQDAPPGWPDDWPYPGVFPPGYEMDMSLYLDANESWFPSSSFDSTTLRLYDHEQYGTFEPTKTLTWTAETRHWWFGATPVGLKLYGDPEFSESVEQTYESIGGIWGKDPDFDFDKTVGDAGQTIYLVCTSSPFDDSEGSPYDNTEIESETEIEIAGSPPPPPPPRVTKMEASLTIDGYEWVYTPGIPASHSISVDLDAVRTKSGTSSVRDSGYVLGGWGINHLEEEHELWQDVEGGELSEFTTTADKDDKVVATIGTPLAGGGHTYNITLEVRTSTTASGTFWGRVTYSDGSTETATENYSYEYPVGWPGRRIRRIIAKEDGSSSDPFNGWNP